MREPSRPTIKRLFALSGNECAFPKCRLPLVDDASGKVTGRICHIKARRPGKRRYDPNQTEEERHGFGNLVLMCPIHHDVIDADEQSYTVARLQEIKAQHEAEHSDGKEPADAVVHQFVAQLSETSVASGSIIFSQNQHGGQVAHSIVNFGAQQPHMAEPARSALISALRDYSPEAFDITTFLFNSDTQRLGSLVVDTLQGAGWVCRRTHQISGNPPVGTIIQTPQEKPSVLVLLQGFNVLGFRPEGFVKNDLEAINIVAGVLP